MQSALWKLAALAGVIGIGGLVVVMVHHRLPSQEGAEHSITQFLWPSKPGADPAPPSDSDHSDEGKPHLADPSDTANQPTPDVDGEDPFGSDPFAMSRPVPTRAKARTPPWMDDQSEPGGSSSNPFADSAAAELQSEPDEPSLVLPVADDPSLSSRSEPQLVDTEGTQPTPVLSRTEGADMPEFLRAERDSRVATGPGLPAAAWPEESSVLPADEPGTAGAGHREIQPVGGEQFAAQTQGFAGEPAGFDPFGDTSSAQEPEPFHPGVGESVPIPPLAQEGQEFGPELPTGDQPGAATEAEQPFAADIQDPFGDQAADPQPTANEDPLPAFGPGRSPVARDAGISPEPARARSLTFDPDPDPVADAVEPNPAESNPYENQFSPNFDAPPARLEYVGDATIDGNSPSGPQQPELTVEKVAPPEATIGEPLIYAIRIKNVGSSAAHEVIVEDRIPRGTTLQGTIPQAELTDKRLVWRLGVMEPNQEKTIRIRVIPTEPGDIGSVATVRFVAEVSSATRITTPQLTLQMSGPREITVGEPAVLHFRITNVGEGEARNVFIRNLLPPGLQHPGGSDIEYEVGVLPVGKSHEVDLTVSATQPGTFDCRAFVNTGSTNRAQANAAIKVIPSRLLIQRQGPARRFVGRPAEYTTTVTNRSNSNLERIVVTETLPPGLELAGAPQGGQFDPQRRLITWHLQGLAAGEATTLRTSVVARDAGNLEGRVSAVDAAGNKAELTSRLQVASFSSLAVDFDHDGRPVAVGERVAMRLTVKNRGTGPAENVQASFEIPDHLSFVDAEGPVEFEQHGSTVRFATLDSLEADGEESFGIVLTAAAAGTTRVTAQLQTQELAEPLRYDEPVTIEGDGT